MDTPERPFERHIYEVRHRNVRMLVEQLEAESGRTGPRAGGVVALAAMLEKAPAQVRHFAGPKPSKPVGDLIAAQIEKAFGKPRDWLDQPQWLSGNVVSLSGATRAPRDTATLLSLPAPSQPVRIDVPILQSALRLLTKILEKDLNEEFDPIEDADLIPTFYAAALASGGKMSKASVTSLTDFVKRHRASQTGGAS